MTDCERQDVDSSSLDQGALYSEGCSALRHYSSRVINVRTIAFAQGIALLGSAGYFLRTGSFILSTSVAGFSLLFTALLYSLQHNYWLHFQAFLVYVIELENGSGDGVGPWSAYDKQRRKRHRKWFWSISAIHGPFLLLLVALLSIMIASFLKM